MGLDIGAAQILGGIAAAGSIKLLGDAASGAAGAGGVFTPGMFPHSDAPPSILSEMGRRERIYEPLRRTGLLGQSGNTTSNRAAGRQNSTTEINYNPTYKLDPSQLVQKQRKDKQEIENRLSRLERAFNDRRL